MTVYPQTTEAPDADWWRGAVIYQIYPRSYQDSNGDGVGDLKGITARLPHIAALGADAIWISPFFPSPMKDFGYDVSNYTDVDPMFGTLSDFESLISEAHRLKIKVMIDLVISHSSDQHAWFIESRSSRVNPKSDWYVGRMRSRMARRPTTGCRFSVGQLGPGTPPACSIICITS